MVFLRKKRPFIKVEYRYPDPLMFIHGIDNNILNYGAMFLRLYQEEYKIREI